MTARIAREQCCENAADRGLACRPCTDLDGRVSWTPAIHLALETRHAPRLCGDDALVTRDLTKWTLLAPAADRRINDARIDRRKRGVIDLKPTRNAGTKRFEQHVGLLGQSPGLAAPFIGFQIQND